MTRQYRRLLSCPAWPWFVLQTEDLTWNGSFNWTKFKTTIENWKSTKSSEILANPGAPSVCCGFLVSIEESNDLGNLHGLIFNGLDNGGNPIFSDENEDGINCVCEADMTTVGNGLPNSFFGLSQQLTYKNFTMDFFIRGAFGHQLFNLPRLFYESPGRVNEGINAVQTQFFDPNQTEPIRTSSFQVEDANFINFDFITLSYDFDFPKIKWIEHFRFYVTLTNPITLTDYSGSTPEVRLKDPGTNDNGSIEERPLSYVALGIDRRNTYLPMKGWILGGKFRF